RNYIIKHKQKLKVVDLLLDQVADSSNTQPYVSSPFTLPPYDSLPPENAPPYCVFPPNTPQTPSTSIPPPILSTLSPPPSPTGQVPSPPEFSYPAPNPPQIVPSPPEFVPRPTTYIPSPPGYILSPPIYEPSPPGFEPSPPSYVPSPIGFVPSPPVFLPPIVYPPPTVPPSPKNSPSIALWCVAKPSVPDPIIQEAMNYACGSGADCDSIQPSGPCFEPDTLFAHASYAFNSYWQRTKVAGGTCDFGGTAILVTVDPSM
ncbi:X8 domain-containing protein, partial [Cephalotus follicularis]